MTYNRHRTMGSFTAVPSRTVTLRCNGTTSTVDSYDAYSNGTYQATSDTVGANWKNVVRNRGLAVHPFTTRKESRFTSGFGWKIRYTPTCSGTGIKEQSGQWYTALRGGSASMDVVEAGLVERLRKEACTRVLANANSAPVMGLVEVGEAKQLGRLASPLLTIQRRIDEIESSKRYKTWATSKGAGIGKFIADNWLWYRYGFQPALRSGQDILAELQREKEHFDRRKTSVKGFQETALVDDTVVVDTFSNFRVEKSTTMVDTVSVRAGLIYDVLLERFSAYGTSAMDIPAAAWELIPYSFLVDWVLNVGDVIATLPRPGVTRQAAWHGVKRVQNQTIVHSTEWKSPVNWTYSSKPDGRYECNVESYTRYPYLTTGLVVRVNPLGDWDSGDWNLRRVADLASLVGTKLVAGFSKPVNRLKVSGVSPLLR